ncbi:MAG: hypothetical protein GEU91_15865 [Rhizobiales bacterium]|nr:hypothetical protein [Hyphomicrobiales bacterium]
MTNKIKKTAFALVTALVAGSASMAQAYEARDANTGLRTEFYYAPLDQLERQGAPISAQARQYLREHPASRAASAGVRSGFDARAQAPAPQVQPRLSNWANPQWRIQQFDGTGAPVGPYPFE